jgi:hypothetical protein
MNTHDKALRFDVSLWRYQRSRPFHEQWGSGNDAFEAMKTGEVARSVIHHEH